MSALFADVADSVDWAVQNYGCLGAIAQAVGVIGLFLAGRSGARWVFGRSRRLPIVGLATSVVAAALVGTLWGGFVEILACWDIGAGVTDGYMAVFFWAIYCGLCAAWHFASAWVWGSESGKDLAAPDQDGPAVTPLI